MPMLFSHIGAVYEKYLDTLYGYALHMGFDEQTTMDAIHDVFYKLCIRYSSINEISNLKFYLFRSLRNRLIDIKRTARENLKLPETEMDNENISFQFHVTIEDELISREVSREIQRKVENVLARLTDRQREIIYLRYFLDLSVAEVAEVADIATGTVKSRLHRALKRLRSVVEQEYPTLWEGFDL